jgi:hypothetical protein
MRNVLTRIGWGGCGCGGSCPGVPTVLERYSTANASPLEFGTPIVQRWTPESGVENLTGLSVYDDWTPAHAIQDDDLIVMIRGYTSAVTAFPIAAAEAGDYSDVLDIDTDYYESGENLGWGLERVWGDQITDRQAVPFGWNDQQDDEVIRWHIRGVKRYAANRTGEFLDATNGNSMICNGLTNWNFQWVDAPDNQSQRPVAWNATQHALDNGYTTDPTYGSGNFTGAHVFPAGTVFLSIFEHRGSLFGTIKERWTAQEPDTADAWTMDVREDGGGGFLSAVTWQWWTTTLEEEGPAPAAIHSVTGDGDTSGDSFFVLALEPS